MHGWENWRLSGSCPAHGHFSQFPSLWKHVSCLRWLSKTKTKLLCHGLAAKYYFHLWLHSRSRKFWSSHTFQKSEGEFFLKELRTATCNIGFDDCLVLGWVFSNRAKQWRCQLSWSQQLKRYHFSHLEFGAPITSSNFMLCSSEMHFVNLWSCDHNSVNAWSPRMKNQYLSFHFLAQILGSAAQYPFCEPLVM
jgi:hypothetical protein